MKYGKNNEGYWTADLFGKQVDDLLDCFDCLHPDWQLMLEVHAHGLPCAMPPLLVRRSCSPLA